MCGRMWPPCSLAVHVVVPPLPPPQRNRPSQRMEKLFRRSGTRLTATRDVIHDSSSDSGSESSDAGSDSDSDDLFKIKRHDHELAEEIDAIKVWACFPFFPSFFLFFLFFSPAPGSLTLTAVPLRGVFGSRRVRLFPVF